MFIGRLLFETFDGSPVNHLNIYDGENRGVVRYAVPGGKFLTDCVETVNTFNNGRVW